MSQQQKREQVVCIKDLINMSHSGGFFTCGFCYMWTVNLTLDWSWPTPSPPLSLSERSVPKDSDALEDSAEGSISDVIDGSADGELSASIGEQRSAAPLVLNIKRLSTFPNFCSAIWDSRGRWQESCVCWVMFVCAWHRVSSHQFQVQRWFVQQSSLLCRVWHFFSQLPTCFLSKVSIPLCISTG